MTISETRFNTFALALYALVSFVLVWHHEPWRDEMQCWEIARSSGSLQELFFNARYEGHPSGWYLLLFAVTRFTPEFGAVQWLHWCIALASVGLVLWRSPFGRWQKGLLVFGYFFLFEYGVLARNYAIGVLLAMALCSLSSDWRRHWLTMNALLFCLLQCNLFAALLALAFFVPLFFRGLATAKDGSTSWSKIGFGALIFLVGLALSATDMAPPADTSFAANWKWTNPDWQPALGAFTRALAPLPPWEMHGWGSHIFFKWLNWDQLVRLECSLSVVLLAACFWSLRKSRFALLFFALAWLGISAFLAVKMQGYIRHHGHFYLAWVMALWLKTQAAPQQEQRFPQYFTTFLFALQVISVLPVAYFDVKYPFSQSKLVADFLTKNQLENRFIVGDYDYAASAVAFHLRRPIYYPNQLQSGTFLRWSKEQYALKYEDVVPVVMELSKHHDDLLMLTSYPIPDENMNDSIKVIKAFYPAVEASEEYYLYEIRSLTGKYDTLKTKTSD